MNPFLQFIADYRLGDLSGILGLLITLVGFTITIIGVTKSKSAAQRAEEAATATRKAISNSNSIAEVSAAIVIMDEIKRLHRIEAWPILPDRYSALRRMLQSMRISLPLLSETDVAYLNDAVQNLNDLEKKVETFLTGRAKAPSAPKVNEMLSRHMDYLDQTLARIKGDQRTESTR